MGARIVRDAGLGMGPWLCFYQTERSSRCCAHSCSQCFDTRRYGVERKNTVARRGRKRNVKSGFQLIGVDKQGNPTCVAPDGRIVVGDGCFSIDERDGKVFVNLNPERCSPDVKKRLRNVLDAVKGGAETHYRPEPETAK
mgnify:CR=1 FL=1